MISIHFLASAAVMVILPLDIRYAQARSLFHCSVEIGAQSFPEPAIFEASVPLSSASPSKAGEELDVEDEALVTEPSIREAARLGGRK